jgi:hypothetical protein
MSNKTIKINPNLFNVGGSFKKKNKPKTSKLHLISSNISPNVLKKKLLKRIHEHKHREIEHNNNAKKNNENKTNIENDSNDSFSNEFNDSINYLQTLSTQQHKNNIASNLTKQKKDLENKTIKNHSLFVSPDVNIQLAEELQPLIPLNTTQFQPLYTQQHNPIQLQPNIPPPPLFSILKNGTKLTKKEWTKKNLQNYTNPPIIHDNDKIEREQRLNKIRLKVQALKTDENKQNNINIHSNNSISSPLVNNINSIDSISTPVIHSNSNSISNISTPIVHSNSNNTSTNISPNLSKIIKKITKHKYILGKSSCKNTIGVSLKSKETCKKIINAQKELKKKPITIKKKYLRDHNLLKIGSNAPNDVINKLYETSILAGEITNINNDTLLYNISKQDTEL